jgi:transcriptional regulator with XRE-family HTH domain
MSQSQIAKALGISQPAVAQLAKKGMPTDSVEAAQAWRSANIGVKRAKAMPAALATIGAAGLRARGAIGRTGRDRPPTPAGRAGL